MRAHPSVEQSSSRTQTRNRDTRSRQGATEKNNDKPTTSRRKSRLQPLKSVPSERTQSIAGNRTPAYLRGKNPYGTVLESIEHPYRDTRTAVEGPPSQAGAGPEGRLRTTGVLRFKTRGLSTQPVLASTERVSARHQPLPERPIKSSAMKATSNSFESSRTRSQQDSRSQPSEPASVVEIAPVKSDIFTPPPPSSSHFEPAREPSLHEQHILDANVLDPKIPLLTRHSTISQTRLSRRDSTFSCLKASGHCGDNATGKPDDDRGTPDAASSPTTSCSPTAKEQSNNQGDARPDTNPTTAQIAGMILNGHNQRQAPEKAVRSRGEHIHPSTTESEEGTAARESQRCHQESERPGPHRHVRGDVKEGRQLESSRLGQSGTGITTFEQSLRTKHSLARVLAWKPSVSPQNTSNRDNGGCHDSIDIHLGSHGRERDTAETTSTDETRVIQPILSTHDGIPTADIGVQPGYGEMQVPDDIDWRAAFGRRKTQDFGFPGARIKPHIAARIQQLPQASSGQSKRFDSHVTHFVPSVISVNGTEQARPQTPAGKQTPAGNMLQAPRIHREQRTQWQFPKAPSTSSLVNSSSTIYQEHCAQDHSDNSLRDKCGDRLANNLGHMIDDLLQEHSSSLQDVIDSINDSQLSLPQLRRPPDKIEMNTGTAYTTYQPPRTYEPANQSRHHDGKMNAHIQNHFLTWLRRRRSQPVFNSSPPTMAEKLNVGATGQLRPNVNDSHYVLRQSLRTINDLVDLVESAADNFGVDLGRRPTASEEQRYQDAPFEST